MTGGDTDLLSSASGDLGNSQSDEGEGEGVYSELVLTIFQHD